MSGDGRMEVLIKLDLPKISKLSQNGNRVSKLITSEPYVIGGVPWFFHVQTEKSKRTSNERFLAVYISCDTTNESPIWSCDAVIQVCLVSRNKDTHFIQHYEYNYRFGTKMIGLPRFIKWDDLTSSEASYITNDCIKFQVLIQLFNTYGFRCYPDFDSPQNELTDIVLVLDDKKMHANKVYLSLHSPVFQAMFFSNFKEKNDDEIVLDDNYEEFVELLRVIYPSRKSIDKKNVEYILKLADKYAMQSVRDECEVFLVECDFPNIQKLTIADRYSLLGLKYRCIQSYKTTTEIKELQKTKEFNVLSDQTKAAFLKRLLEIV